MADEARRLNHEIRTREQILVILEHWEEQLRMHPENDEVRSKVRDYLEMLDALRHL